MPWETIVTVCVRLRSKGIIKVMAACSYTRMVQGAGLKTLNRIFCCCQRPLQGVSGCYLSFLKLSELAGDMRSCLLLGMGFPFVVIWKSFEASHGHIFSIISWEVAVKPLWMVKWVDIWLRGVPVMTIAGKTSIALLPGYFIFTICRRKSRHL